MSQAIGNILVAAVGVALSPLPIIALVLVIGTKRARVCAPAFGLGWVTGLTVLSLALVFATGTADEPGSAVETGVPWGKALIGVACILLAVKQWRSRPKQGEEAELPGWMSKLDEVAPGKAFLMGAGLGVANPKNVACTAAASASISQAGLTGGSAIVAVAVFVVLGSLTIVGPVLCQLLAAERAAAPLARTKEFMVSNNAVIMMVVLLLIGTKILGDAFGGV